MGKGATSLVPNDFLIQISYLYTCSISLTTDRTVGTGTGNLQYKINIKVGSRNNVNKSEANFMASD